ncbi:TPA: peptidoglycan-binding domain-containing protein, partial [Escherichia coli]
RALNITSVGKPDGVFGAKTVGALSQFQAHEGLPVTGRYDDATREALKNAEPAESMPERKRTSAADLKAAGSRTIATADKIGLVGKAKILAGTVFGTGAVAEKAGLLDQAQDAVDKVNQAKGLYDSVHDLAGSLFASPTVIACAIALVVAGVAVWLLAERIK